MLVLAEEGDQAPAERLQVRRGRGAPGDEGARPPARRDPPSQHHLLGARGQPLGELRQLRVVEQPGGQVEDALDPGLLGARPHDPRFRLAAHQQVERVREHRLPRPGLTGDRVQPLAEPQFGPFDQQQVLDPQLAQHSIRFSTARGGSSGVRRAICGTPASRPPSVLHEVLRAG